MLRDLAVDLGSATTTVVLRGERELMTEPSVLARVVESGEVLAVGHRAAQMVGRTPEEIETVHPFQRGSVVDFPAAQQLIRGLLRRVGVRRRHRVRAVVAVPSAITSVERRAVGDAFRLAGASDTRLLGQTMAAALGHQLPLDQAVGSLVVDIGAGTTEAAVLSLGGVVALEWRRVGGFDLDRDISDAVERRHGLTIDHATAEDAKLRLLGSDPGPDPDPARDRRPDAPLLLQGRLAGSGAAGGALLTRNEAADATEETVRRIVDVVLACVGWAPPEIANDLQSTGIHLAGGTARLDGLAERLAEACRIPVTPVVDPEQTIIRGAARCLGRFDSLAEVFLAEDWAET